MTCFTDICIINIKTIIMSSEALNQTVINKPVSIRIIFILNALKVLLALGFYVAFKDKAEPIIDPVVILYTAIGYAVMFAAIVFSILKRSAWGLRIAIIIDFIISIPATAIIGFVISAVSFGLTFRKSAKAYLGE